MRAQRLLSKTLLGFFMITIGNWTSAAESADSLPENLRGSVQGMRIPDFLPPTSFHSDIIRDNREKQSFGLTLPSQNPLTPNVRVLQEAYEEQNVESPKLSRIKSLRILTAAFVGEAETQIIMGQRDQFSETDTGLLRKTGAVISCQYRHKGGVSFNTRRCNQIERYSALKGVMRTAYHIVNKPYSCVSCLTGQTPYTLFTSSQDPIEVLKTLFPHFKDYIRGDYRPNLKTKQGKIQAQLQRLDEETKAIVLAYTLASDFANYDLKTWGTHFQSLGLQFYKNPRSLERLFKQLDTIKQQEWNPIQGKLASLMPHTDSMTQPQPFTQFWRLMYEQKSHVYGCTPVTKGVVFTAGSGLGLWTFWKSLKNWWSPSSTLSEDADDLGEDYEDLVNPLDGINHPMCYYDRCSSYDAAEWKNTSFLRLQATKPVQSPLPNLKEASHEPMLEDTSFQIGPVQSNHGDLTLWQNPTIYMVTELTGTVSFIAVMLYWGHGLFNAVRGFVHI